MNDQYEGQGGSYVIDESGERKLVERTRNLGEAPPDPAEPAAQDQPASAGFFTPVAPAEQSTTTE
jgi:hypothetical protein